MGSVIHLSEWRERRERDPMTRLDRAIARLDGLLRRQGIGDLGEVRYAVLEPRGQLSVIRHAERSSPEPPLVRDIVARTSPRA